MSVKTFLFKKGGRPRFWPQERSLTKFSFKRKTKNLSDMNKRCGASIGVKKG